MFRKKTLEILLRIRKKHICQHANEVLVGKAKLVAHSLIKKENLCFKEMKYFSKKSTGTRRMRFDNPVGNVWPKRNTFCSKFWKNAKDYICLKKNMFLENFFCDLAECGFDNDFKNLQKKFRIFSSKFCFLKETFPKRFNCSI